MVAAERGHGDIVKILQESGADIDARDKSCRTALNLAETDGRVDSVDYLKTLGAK